MANNLSPSGIIFDFDGVVADSLAVHLKAWRASFQRLYGLELADVSDLPGRSTAAIAEILAGRVGRPETKDRLAEMKRDALRDSEFSIDLLPGAAEAFDFLTTQKIPFGIASNAPRAFIEQTLHRLGISVTHKFGIDDVARPKPEPDVFLKCAKALGVSVLEHPRIIVFEDSPHGLRAAVRAGMFPVGVLTQNSASEMRTAGARAVCDTIADAMNRGWLAALPG